MALPVRTTTPPLRSKTDRSGLRTANRICAVWLIALTLAFNGTAFAHESGAGSPVVPPPESAGIQRGVRVVGDGGQWVRFDHEALARQQRTTVDGNDHGAAGRWEGVRLIDLLKAVGAASGDTLRGASLRRYVRVDAADGYAVVFALAELDATFGDQAVILADTRDGQPLSAHEGPFRIVAAGDKRPGRWVRQVTAVTLLEAPAPAPR